METMLIVMASVSTAAAVGLAAMLVKMLRDERRRSDARVQALMDVAGVEYLASTVREPADKLVPSHFHAIPEGHERPAAKPGKPAKRAAATPQAPVFQDLDLNPSRVPSSRGPSSAEASRFIVSGREGGRAPGPPASERVSGIDSMFAEPERRSPWPNRIAVAAACAAFVALLGFVWLPGSRGGSDTQQAVTGTSGSAAPLELLALGHTADADGLTISGIVQNPRGGTALTNVVASASLFASDGAVVANGSAPLDFTQLRPGDESPFVVKVPTPAGVSRYRVSFRNDKGTVLGHIDRRAADPVARRQ
jgi:hypothetical protein